MNNLPIFVNRLLLAVGLAAVVAGALFNVSPAGADPPTPRGDPLGLPAPTEPVTTVDKSPTIDHFEITEVGGTQATLVVRTSAPTIISYTIRRVDGRAHDDGSGTAGLPTTGYVDEYRVRLLNLQSNTTYEVAVYATNGDGQTTATKRFTTPKQRVRITLREINITKDGDIWWSNGEPRWWVRAEWAGGFSGGCYPNNCEFGSYSEGRIFPRNSQGQFLSWTFAEENFDTMPTSFRIYAAGEESDSDIVPDILIATTECFDGGKFCGVLDGLNFSTDTWQVPAGQDFASTPVFVDTVDGQGFHSTMAFTFELFYDNLSYPVSARNRPQSTW